MQWVTQRAILSIAAKKSHVLTPNESRSDMASLEWRAWRGAKIKVSSQSLTQSTKEPAKWSFRRCIRQP